jgi:hypothetical protein
MALWEVTALGPVVGSPTGYVFVARHPDTLCAYGLGFTQDDAKLAADRRLAAGEGPIEAVGAEVGRFLESGAKRW